MSTSTIKIREFRNNGIRTKSFVFDDCYPFGMFCDACFSSSEKLSRTNPDVWLDCEWVKSGQMPGRNSEGGYRYDARLTGSVIITATAVIPIFGPVISLSLGVLDAYGAFDDIYNSFDE